MALASATTSRIEFDELAAVAHLSLLGGQVQPWKTSFALLRAIIAEAQTQLDSVALDSSFSREENLRSAVMKIGPALLGAGRGRQRRATARTGRGPGAGVSTCPLAAATRSTARPTRC